MKIPQSQKNLISAIGRPKITNEISNENDAYECFSNEMVKSIREGLQANVEGELSIQWWC